jgi:hypothetical protein
MLGAVIEVPVLAVLHARQDLPLSRAIAFQLIGDEPPRHVRQPLEPLAEESLRVPLIPLPLHENIQDIAVLIHGPPQVGPFATDAQKDLVQVPLITGSRAPPTELMGMGLPECPAPIPHRFIGQDHPALGHELFDVPIAEAKAIVEPHTMTDDLCREPVTLDMDWLARFSYGEYATRAESGSSGQIPTKYSSGMLTSGSICG